MSNKFLFEIRTVYETMWQNMVEPDVAENTQFSFQIIHAEILYLLNYLDAFGGIYQCVA